VVVQGSSRKKTLDVLLILETAAAILELPPLPKRLRWENIFEGHKEITLSGDEN
jgi:hypothetical protein